MLPRRTKIVATLGPACADAETLAQVLRAGVDVVRINGSHGSHASHAQAIALTRAIAEQMGRPVGILFDLQGPKIRIGAFAGPPRPIAHLESFTLAVGRPAGPGELPCDYSYLDRDVSVGAPLLIDDGNLICKVTHVSPGRVVAQAQHAGHIAQRKGINLPDTEVTAPAISDKDRADALFAVAQGVDFIAMSFVRHAQDITDLKALLAEAGASTPIIAKIEVRQALTNLEAIIHASWGVMVARGDLGVELPASEVPMAQKRIIRAAREQGRPVITATQMLDSMTRNPRPTRAEASDVANAVLDGTDAVMLSQETAAGIYPAQTVATMGEIIAAAQDHSEIYGARAADFLGPHTLPTVLARSACTVAQDLGAPAIVVFTQTGRMALWTSERRPLVPIIALASSAAVQRRLCLVWGVQALLDVPHTSTDDRLRALEDALTTRALANRGQHVVLLMGAPGGPSGSTHLIMVHEMGGPRASD